MGHRDRSGIADLGQRESLEYTVGTDDRMGASSEERMRRGNGRNQAIFLDDTGRDGGLLCYSGLPGYCANAKDALPTPAARGGTAESCRNGRGETGSGTSEESSVEAK